MTARLAALLATYLVAPVVRLLEMADEAHDWDEEDA